LQFAAEVIVSTAEGNGKQPFVLIVDDDPDTSDVFCAIIGSHGYRVKSARTRDEALQIFTCEIPDLMLLDHRMPGMPVDEFAMRLRELEKKPRVILMSAESDGINQLGKMLNADATLPKPFNVDALLTQISKLTSCDKAA